MVSKTQTNSVCFSNAILLNRSGVLSANSGRYRFPYLPPHSFILYTFNYSNPLSSQSNKRRPKHSTIPLPRSLNKSAFAAPSTRANVKMATKSAATATIKVNAILTRTTKKQSIFSKLHRLRSIEDRRWIHKLCSICCIVSTTTLALYGLGTNFLSTFVSLPSSTLLHPWIGIWATSVTIQAVSGAFMAIKFRRREQSVRDAFLSNSFISLLNVCINLRVLYHSTFPLFQQLILPLCALSAIYILKALRSANQLIHSRRSTRQSRTQQTMKEKLGDLCCYVLPESFPLPFILVAVNFFNAHDSVWISSQLQTMPGLREVCLYANVLGTLAVSFVSFLVTLRDRRMISKSIESKLILFASIASLACTMWLIQTNLGLPYFLSLLKIQLLSEII